MGALVRLESFAAHQRGPGNADLLSNVRENPALLGGDPARELRSFRVAAALISSSISSQDGTGVAAGAQPA